MYIELEELVPRRDYKLKINWVCVNCKPEDQNRSVKLKMCLLDGEEGNDPNYSLTETDLVHMECFKGHITRPKRYCSRCGMDYKFEDDICNMCEARVRDIIEAEHTIEELREKIRIAKRNKEDYKSSTEKIKELEEWLVYVNGRT